MLQHVLVEARGKVVDEDVASSAWVALVVGGSEGTVEGESGFLRFGKSLREAEVFTRLLRLESDGDYGVRVGGLVAEDGEVEVEEEEPEEYGEGSEKAKSGIRVFGVCFLHLVGENTRHGAPSHWVVVPIEKKRVMNE